VPYGVLPVDTTRKPLSCERVTVNWEHPLNRQLVMWYLVNEASGSVVHDIARVGPASLVASPAWGVGERGNHIVLDGSTQYLNVPASTYRNVDTWYFSFSAQAYLTDLTDGSIDVIFNFSPDGIGSGGIRLQLIHSGTSTQRMRLSHVTSSQYYLVESVNGVVLLNTWQQWTVTYDRRTNNAATNLHIYCNGLEVAYATQLNYSGVPVVTNNFPLFIGMRNAVNQYWTGNLTDIQLWSGRILTPTLVLGLYEHPYGTPDNPRLI